MEVESHRVLWYALNDSWTSTRLILNLIAGVDMPSKAKSAKKSKAPPAPKVEFIPGKTDILVIAPHGVSVPGVDNDDTNTAFLARKIADDLKCSALINHSIKRTTVDYNRKKEAEKDKDFIGNFRSVLDAKGPTLVVWIHGYDKEKQKSLQEQLNPGGDLDCIIGHGQGLEPRDTAHPKTVDRLISLFRHQEIVACCAKQTPPSKEYCGYSLEIMNQWCRQQKEYQDLDTVQSIQLEFKEPGFRDTKEQAEAVGLKVAKALRIMVRPTDKALVPMAYEHLQSVFVKHFKNAVIEAGQYIIDTFYGGDAWLAFAKNKSKNSPPSLRSLIDKLKSTPADPSGDAPSESWLYKAVSLASHVPICQELGLSTFTILGHSHQLQLLNVPKLKEIKADEFDEKIKKAFEIKDNLAQIAVNENLSVRAFSERIKIIHPDTTIYLSVGKVPADATLEQVETSRLKHLQKELTWHIADKKKKLKQHEEDKARVKKVIEARPKDKRAERNVGFRDWTEPACNVNIQKGCSNNCLYCYAKTLAYKREQKALGTWADQMIRLQDVDKPRNLYHGLVGFPSTHDITPENVDDFIYVLGKLLRAGNEVLIVSKPRLECIRQICEASLYFKDKILFRFTIGAMNKDILEFWEPEAPPYQVRKEALKYAYDQGFRTSVSIEPMLDSENVVAMVDDLMPYVTKDVWIGKMNHIDQFAKGATGKLKEEVARLEAGQTDVRLKALHEAFKGNK